MTPTALYADCLISGLAGLAFLGLRGRLRDAGLTGRLLKMLRFLTGLFGVFFLLRIPAWLTGWDVADRILLATAALIPLAITLLAEAALARHAPRSLKRFLAIGTPLLMLGAFTLPDSAAPVYLPALLLFQIASLVSAAILLWRGADDLTLAQLRLLRAYGLLVLLSAPLIATDFTFLQLGPPLHLSALVVLIGIWLAVSSASWTANPTSALLSLGVLSALALGSAALLTSGLAAYTILAATLLAILLFSASLGEALRLRAGSLADRLTTFLTLGPDLSTETALQTQLASHDPVVIEGPALEEFDRPALARALARSPLWSASRSTRADEDIADQMTELLRRSGSTHLLATGTDPLRLIGLTLAPVESTAQVKALLAAAAWRLRGGDPQ